MDHECPNIDIKTVFHKLKALLKLC